ncbi:MAG TPA: plastocyanin/azurin family copper-binding protein [Dehalococcoidia bacterium]|jgi:plastocyanin|nr:plastocyanin/azurin family copper-binding protein [Dehalococcoidia bacterium]
MRRFCVRAAVLSVVLAAALLAGLVRSGTPVGPVHAQAVKDTARVVIVDSNATFSPANEYLGQWGFAPSHVTVTQGEPIEFDNPAGNFFPHTVTSITWSGSPTSRTLTVGAAFNSSPTNDAFLTPGTSFTLDTSTLQPGQYLYFCSIHPWMVGTITVTAPDASATPQ